jgi:hypothetical protein
MGEWFFLDRDNSSHWYLVPTPKREEWVRWTNLPEDDERSWDAPEFAKRLDGSPNRVEFQNPMGGF